MDIIGHGFLAQHLASIAGSHDRVVALAAGVSAAAATTPEQFRREADLVASVLDRCLASGERLLFFSTASTGIYGAAQRGSEDEDAVPCTPYGQHKLRLERLIQASGADYLIVRLAHVAGPSQPGHQLLPSLINQITAGEVTLHDGARRDIIDVADVVTVIDHLLGAGVSRDVVNIATGWPVPVEDLVSWIERESGRTARRAIIRRPPVNYHICTAKLRHLVPEVADMGFGAHYYTRVLGRYLLAAV